MADMLYTIIIYPIVQIIEFGFAFAQYLFKETGLSIVFVSGVVSILCLPLYMVAENWQEIERNIQKKLAPKIAKIKAVFTGDERYMILSTYYRQNHYHPVYAMRSTFGLLIQIPFFIAAYSYLSNFELLENVPFYFINDLGSPDALFSIGGFTANILPFVMTFINCLSGALYTKNLPARDKVQLYGMAGIFLILLYNSPSGLVLYWTMNNVFSLLKNLYYRLQIRHKRLFLLSLFSFSFISLSVFCKLKYSYFPPARLLVYICIFVAIVPWICIFFRNQLSYIFNIKYERNKSFAVFILSIFLIWVLLGLFLPSQLIVSSPQEFSFIDEYTNPVFFIFITALQVLGMFIFWPVCLYFLFSDNTKKYLSLFFLAVSTVMVINVFLFPGNYGLISINFVYDNGGPSHSATQIYFNLFLILIVLASSILIYRLKNKKIIPTLILLFFFPLFGISFINISQINSSFTGLNKYFIKEEKSSNVITPIFSLSQNGKNVVVIMLDRATSVFMPFIFEELPELLESYSGFIYYPNTVSFNGWTLAGSPPLYGGYEYTPLEVNRRENIPLMEKHNQALLMMPRVFSENGFSVCITDPPYANLNLKSDLSIFDDYPDIQAFITDAKYTDLWLDEHDLNLPLTSDILKRNMFLYSLLKASPLFLRSLIYLNGEWCSPAENYSLRMTINGYSVLDYLPRLTQIRSDNADTALIMANNTTHEGSFMQAPDYVPAITVSNYGNSRFSKEHAYHVNAASIKRLSDWFDFMKKNNVYDNTRIILVSDHGHFQNFVTTTDLPFNVDNVNPLLMVKNFNTFGTMRTDMSFMSNADVPYLSFMDIIENPINPFTGNAVSIEPKNNALYIAISAPVHISDKSAFQYKFNPEIDYYVHDNIFDENNWIRADRYQHDKD